MKLAQTNRQAAPSRLLDIIVWVAIPLLIAMTLFTVVYTIGIAGIGGRDLYVQGSTGAVVIEHVTPAGESVRHDLHDPTDELAALQDGSSQFRFLGTTVQATVSGFAARAVLITVALIRLTAAWIAAWNLRGIARSSLRGEIFTASNSRRLAWLGATAIAYPALDWFVGRSVFNSAVTEVEVGVTGFVIDHGMENRIMWFAVGLLLLTLAQAFARGIELQELEAATI